MYTEDLKIQKDIDVKIHRLNSPSFNTNYIPLSGLYNPIDNIESEEYALNNKFKNFDLSSNKCANIENLLGVNNPFGKIFTNENLEALLTLANICEHEVIVKDLKITIKSDDKTDKKKTKEQVLEIKLPNNYLPIAAYRGYTFKITTELKYLSRYTIEINFNTRSSKYDQHYYKLKQRTMVREKTENYNIIDGFVEYFNNKKLSFDSNNPFKITEIFHNIEVNACLIEIRIFNPSIYPLTIYDLYLTPKTKNDQKIKIFKNLDEFKNLSNDSKYLMIQSDEQINLLFKIDNPDLFYDEDKFILNILWMKDFDFLPKSFIYEFNNNLNTYNDYYKMTVIEKPKDDITINQNFKIVINLKSKNINNKYIISLSQEPIKDNDKTNDREIEIIDIIEKKMELNSKNPSNNFILICKSDVLGNVYLPKLKFSLYEGDKNNPIENSYKGLLSFNCISKRKNTNSE